MQCPKCGYPMYVNMPHQCPTGILPQVPVPEYDANCDKCKTDKCFQCFTVHELRSRVTELTKERDDAIGAYETCAKICADRIAERDRLKGALEELCDIIETAHEEGNYKDHIDSFTTQPARKALGGDRE